MLSNFSILHSAVMLLVLAYLAMSIWAIILTARDKKLKTGDKGVWIASLVVVPVGVLLVWFSVALIRRRQNRQSV